ncbi:MAG: hypothetical protein HZR80_05020 [Candidatus Heimdallarchaeota archaeon]
MHHILVSFSRTEKRHNYFKNVFGDEAITFQFELGKDKVLFFPEELERLIELVKSRKKG